jgi:hypothetical protein
LSRVESAKMLQCYWGIDDLIRQAQVSFAMTSPSIE